MKHGSLLADLEDVEGRGRCEDAVHLALALARAPQLALLVDLFGRKGRCPTGSRRVLS